MDFLLDTSARLTWLTKGVCLITLGPFPIATSDIFLPEMFRDLNGKVMLQEVSPQVMFHFSLPARKELWNKSGNQ